MTIRVCLLGLPRCGSQYVCDLIIRNTPNITCIDEPFTPNHHSANFTQDSFGYLHKSQDEIVTLSVEEQIDRTINLLEKSNINQSVVFKLFLLNDFPYDHYAAIVKVIKNQNFKFLILKRINIVDQILSFLISNELNTWSNFTSIPDNRIAEVKNFGNIDYLIDQIKNFETTLKNLHLNTMPVINYETAKVDLEKYFHRPFVIEPLIRKMSNLSNQKRVSNFDEVMAIINKKIKL